MAVRGGKNITSDWVSGNLVFFEASAAQSVTTDVLTLSNTAVKVGGTDNDIDFQYYGTGSVSAIINNGDATFIITGIATTMIGALTVGDGSTDVDFKAFFGSANNYLLVDEGNEKVTVAKTWATASATGRPLEVDSTVNAALGAYSNAIKGYVVYGTSGYTTGLGSAVNAEILLSAGTSQGTYAPLESEIVINTNGSTGTQTGFLYCNATGTAASTFDTNGYFVIVGTGITPASGKFASANSQTLRCSIDGSTRYMVFSQTENGLGIGVSGTEVSYTAGTPLVTLYATAAGSGTTNCEPFYMYSILTGTSPVGGRARFHTYINVAAGGWTNALKGYVEYGASGRTTGLGSAVCAEILLTAGTTSGTYAPLESELVANTNASTGTSTSFLHCNGSGTAVATTIDTSACLLELGTGLTVGSGKFIDTAITALTAYGGLRVRIPGVGIRWIALVSA